MPSNITPFFATQEDIIKLFEQVSRRQKLKFSETGLFDSQTNNGYIAIPTSSPARFYLISLFDEPIKSIPIPQRDGTRKFSIDQDSNVNTVAIKLCVVISDEKCLLSGQVGTISKSSVSKLLYNSISKEMKKNFIQIKSFLVGPEAVRMLDSGYRLSSYPKADPMYDLSRD